MSTNIKTFKISNLSAMSKADITSADLFLISDTDDAKTNSKYVSKKLTFGNLSAAISDGIATSIATLITPTVTLSVLNVVEPKIDQTVVTKISEVLSSLDLGGAFE